jgi:phosphate transport system protein
MIEKEVNLLKEYILKQASRADKMINNSIKGLVDGDKNILKKVIDKQEQKVNKNDIKIEKFCIRTIALYQPEAVFLRTVFIINKMNYDLERMADHSVSIAKNAIRIADEPLSKFLNDIIKIKDLTLAMLKDSMKSFIEKDSILAREVCVADDEVDDLAKKFFKEVLKFMMENPKNIEKALSLIDISDNLERIADLTTNIAESVVYMVEGKIIKHHWNMRENKTKVLFICGKNSVKSQMAEAFLRKFGKSKFYVVSAGLKAGVLNPYTVEVMKEEKIYIAKNITKSLDMIMKIEKSFDYVITLCDEANCNKIPNLPWNAKIIRWEIILVKNREACIHQADPEGNIQGLKGFVH